MKYDFEVDTNTTFKHLSDNLYDSFEGAVSKLLRDRTDAIKQTVGTEEGILKIDVYDNSSYTKLIVHDNSHGTRPEDVNDCIIPYFQLVGSNGGFEMRSTTKDGQEITGYWTNQGFKNTSGEAPESIGTIFNFVLKDDIDTNQLVEHIKKSVRFSSISTTLSVYEDDEFYDSYDLGQSEIVENSEKQYIYEDNYVKAVIPSNLDYNVVYDGIALCQDTPVDSPTGLTVKIKTNKPVVLDGPNKGLIVGEDIDEAQDGDIVLPQLVTGQHRLGENEQFWDWLSEKLKISEFSKIYPVNENNSTTGYFECESKDGKLVLSTYDDNIVIENDWKKSGKFYIADILETNPTFHKRTWYGRITRLLYLSYNDSNIMKIFISIGVILFLAKETLFREFIPFPEVIDVFMVGVAWLWIITSIVTINVNLKEFVEVSE